MQSENNKTIWLSALIFSIVFCAIPWPQIHKQLRGYEFRDRQEYEEYFEYEESVLTYADFSDPISYVTGEYAWHFGMGYLVNDLNFPLNALFGVISFGCIFIFSIVLAVNRGALSLILLFNPLLVDLAFSQLRSALAATMLALAYLLRSRLAALPIVVGSAFVHTASLLLLAMYAVATICVNRARVLNGQRSVQFVTLCFAGVVISLSTGPYREAILSAVGDRRAEYADMTSSTSYLLYWALLLAAAATKINLVTLRVESAMAIIVLSFVGANIIFGGYSTRILAISLPFIFTMMIGFTGPLRFILLATYMTYASAQWLHWMNL